MNSTLTNRKTYRPQLSFFHANSKGTGCALVLELIPACGNEEGCVRAKIANQMTIGDRSGPNPVYPRFDWENVTRLKLGFNDLCKMLQVFRGDCESLEDGKGLYHRSTKAMTRICLRHVIEPLSGYSLETYRTAQATQEESRAHILLSPHEALGLTAALESSMGVLCFGVPVAESAVHAGEGREEEVRDVA